MFKKGLCVFAFSIVLLLCVCVTLVYMLYCLVFDRTALKELINAEVFL
jgi:hypothetical protein